MQSKHECILRSINSSRDNFRILSFPTHERSSSNLEPLKHTFYLYQGQNIKPWCSKYAELPKNHILLSGQKDQIKQDMKFDIVLSQNKFGQYEVAKSIADELSIPLISFEHTLPFVEWKQEQTKQVNGMRGDFNVFISEYSMKEWGSSLNDPTVRILHHGVNTEVFKPNHEIKREKFVLVVANDYINREWCLQYSLYKKLVLDNKLPTIALGDTPGLSKSAKGVYDLANHYCRSSVFLNTSLISPIPTVVLEAMACECLVVTTSNCMLPEIIEDGVNGFISNDEKILLDRIKWGLENPDKAREMGKNARKTILEKFSMEKHLENWNKLLDEAYGSCHKV